VNVHVNVHETKFPQVFRQGFIVAPKRATLKDVAERAGVSYQTVSRVVNGKADVLPATRRRVAKALRALNYRPSAIARSMVAGRAFTLACISPNLTDYTFASLIEGAEAEARQNGYLLLSASAAQESDVALFCEEIVHSGRVDGVLVINPYADSRHRHFEKLFAQGIPVVYVGARPRRGKIHSVHLDDEDVGYQAAKYLLQLGHHQIATLLGPSNEDCVSDRLEGYKRALAEAGIPFSKKLVAQGDWSASSGYTLLQRLLTAQTPFTAVFAQNDRIAIGAIRALREHGLRVPDEVSVLGVDDMPLASYFDPPLTTFRQDTFQIGRTAAQLMLQSIEKRRLPGKRISLPATLIVRASTRAIGKDSE
jgi:DNA-binding LacI/PurR family transcriptional regulator